MVKVLHIMAGADAGGISTVVLNYWRWMDRSKVHFDIALTTSAIGQNAEEFKKLGAEIYQIPMKSKNMKGFETKLCELLRHNKYDAIHVHENDTSYVALRIAKHEHIPVRFAHAHSTLPTTSIKSYIKRLSGCMLNSVYATKVIGCGKFAGERIFGKINMSSKKGTVIPNAIDLQKFGFSSEIRSQIRNELHVADKFVVSLVGRFSSPKNHEFALQLFGCYHSINPKAVLLLIGNGELENKIRGIIEQQHMQDYVYMLGRRSDVSAIYQGSDVLIMPSHFEGFPVAAVEALATGLPVLMSKRITTELEFCNAAYYLTHNSMPEWISGLQKICQGDTNRCPRGEELREHNLDIRLTAQILQNMYLEGMDKK